ncbi:TPA: phage tail tape measure protein [Enterococcus faecium]|uniref:phage tail tape measure protein n=2 Tax=Enterococcus faecium TaxID=1352 RepID=UPI0001EB7614|nr:phage tail tape measure protein [Enterococcus faecium]EFR67518.1 phage tail tape measure protein, TP901 family [Enterococcus faecium TX0133a01]EFR69896.1 phage tail tape measure protein, TP901 family [Enterococcus faecium TX0133B]EFR73080.1 phage tail tape measure protein, TP901 family [Enterococcus faecium TX0133A]EFR79154.1 phage tail tape measure protein, TP901 family [Enterococcus faecium TX0133C]EFS06812.1 phage tail tape measure protein, TP901 family [Enterococcus faecium TX0133a04]
MEQFSVEALLKATDSGFVKTFKDAQDAVKTFEKNSNSMTTAVGKVMQGTGAAMTKYITTPLIGVGVAAAKVGGDFEAQMSRVKAISGATGDTFEQMKQQAIDLGAKTAFSAKESAAGMENLASAGFSAQEIMKAMPGLLDLAAVSGGDVALASENTATALRGFGLEASEAGHVADVFARAAADTNAEVGDMGEALKYVAPVANSMGISLEETAAAIGIMSDAGIKGSQAGTTLRGALSRLARPTKAMQDTMDNLGVSFYDADGKMKPLKTQVELLKKAFEGLTPEQQQNALVTLYGQESLSGMMALIDKGPDSLGKLTKSLKDSDGAADDMARTMQDNMNSSIEQMFGAFESAAIVIQKILAPSIRKVADAISGLVEKFVSAPESTQRLVVAIGAIVAAIGPLIFMIGSVIIWINRVKVAFKALSESSKLFSGLSKAMGLLTNPVFLVIAAVALLVVGFIYLWNTSEDFRNFWIGLWEGIKSAVSSAVEWIQNAWKSTGEWFNNLWKSIKEGADNVWTTIQEAPGKAADWIKNKWTETKEFFSSIWDGIKEAASSAWEGIVNILAPYVIAIKNVFQPMIDFFTNLWSQIGSIAGSAWEIIKTAVMGPILLLIDLITGNFNQLKEDASMLWTTLTTNIQNIITTFVDIVVAYYTALKDTVINIWNVLTSTIKDVWNSFTTWIKETTNNIVNSIKQGWNNLKQGTIDLFNNMIQGAKDLWNSFKAWFINLVIGTKDNIIQGWENLKQGTIDTFNNLVSGAQEVWDNLVNAVSDTVDRVTGWFDNLKNIDLLAAGKAIMDSFLEGLQNAWKSVQDFVGGIGDWIREHKGPIQYDRKLLIPAGQAIMNGLHKGLMGGFNDVQNTVGGMADFIAELFNANPDVDIAANLKNANKNIGAQVEHKVNMGGSTKPAVFKFNLGRQSFRLFVDDISQAMGEGADINLEF